MKCPLCGWSIKELPNAEVGDNYIVYICICDDCDIEMTIKMNKQKYVDNCNKYNITPYYEKEC
tara:strand:+ start:33 stop:221 length:189 start_codon:yes stop_codon:yes gene_type:complete